MTIRQLLANGTPINVAGNDLQPRAVIVLQEAFGVNTHIRDVTDRFAAQGFLAVAPELFHRAGSPEVPYDDFASALGLLGDLNAEDLEEDLRATVSWLNAQGYRKENVAIVGYCMGGTVATFAGTLGLVGAVASFYGGGVVNGRFGLPSMVEMAPNVQCPWIGLYGQLDKGIPADQVEALEAAIKKSGHESALHYFADADHGFHSDDRHPVYNAKVAKEAWQITLDFLASQAVSK